MKNTFSMRASPWPARLDLAQSLTGLILALFMWFHMGFVSSILLGKDAFWTVARFFEGQFIFGKGYPIVVSMLVAAIFTLIIVHALLALRKFPANWQQYQIFWSHSQNMQHGDTSLWLVQVITGFAMFFLSGIHLYTMLVEPELIDPYGSADLVWSGRMWPMLLLLLICVEVHGTIGLYRLAMKWGWPNFGDPTRTRHILRQAMWGLIFGLIGMGLVSLFVFAYIGAKHAPYKGELYTPSWMIEKSQ